VGTGRDRQYQPARLVVIAAQSPGRRGQLGEQGLAGLGERGEACLVQAGGEG